MSIAWYSAGRASHWRRGRRQQEGRSGRHGRCGRQGVRRHRHPGEQRRYLKRAYETFPDKTFIARTPLIPGVNDDEEHIRAVLALIRPYPNVVDYELLPCMRFGESKYGFLGRIYEMQDFEPPTPEKLERLRAIIDETFGRSGAPVNA